MTVLKPLPTHRIERIAVGTCIRKPKDVLDLYLKHLDAQVLPPHVRLVPYMALDMDDPEACATVESWVEERGGTIIRSQEVAKDFDDSDPVTHRWTASAFYRVADLKNRLIRQAMEDGCTAFWFVDADLLCDPMTFKSMYELESRIVSAVYWTRWNHDQGDAMPQVWLTHPYGLEGRGMDWPTFRRRLVTREVTEVWGQGACTLIRDAVFQKGVDFTNVEGLPTEGMWQGEDRSFCIRAERAHIPMMADPWPDIFHIYAPSDRGVVAEEWSQRLLAQQDGSPAMGDLVNVRLQPLEPVGPHRLGSFFWRGRIGCGRLVDELDDLMQRMTRGQEVTEAIHFPVDYPNPMLRGLRRIFHVTLVDHRPYRLAPNLTPVRFGTRDTGLYTPRQLEAVSG